MPEEDPLQIGIAVEQESLFGLEGARELVEKEPQRFRQPLIHLHGRIDAREEIDLRHKPAANAKSVCGAGAPVGSQGAPRSNKQSEMKRNAAIHSKAAALIQRAAP